MRDLAVHFLFENKRFSTKMRDLAAHFIFENWRFSTKMRDFAAHFLFENGRYSTKIHDLVAHFLFESKRFSTKIRDLARITFVDIGMTRGFHRIKRGCVRTAGAAGALRAGSVAGLFWVCKTRHVVLVFGENSFDDKLLGEQVSPPKKKIPENP